MKLIRIGAVLLGGFFLPTSSHAVEELPVLAVLAPAPKVVNKRDCVDLTKPSDRVDCPPVRATPACGGGLCSSVNLGGACDLYENLIKVTRETSIAIVSPNGFVQTPREAGVLATGFKVIPGEDNIVCHTVTQCGCDFVGNAAAKTCNPTTTTNHELIVWTVTSEICGVVNPPPPPPGGGPIVVMPTENP